MFDSGDFVIPSPPPSLGSEPLVYLNTERRERLVSMRNNRGETPLHVLARASLVKFGDAGNRPPGLAGLTTPSGRTSAVSMQVSFMDIVVVFFDIPISCSDYTNPRRSGLR